MNSHSLVVTELINPSSLLNKSIEKRILDELLAKRSPVFVSFVYDKRALAVFIVLYYGTGSDYIYSNDMYTNEEAYSYVEVIYDELKAITNEQAFQLEREIRKFSGWKNLKKQPKNFA